MLNLSIIYMYVWCVPTNLAGNLIFLLFSFCFLFIRYVFTIIIAILGTLRYGIYVWIRL